MSSYYDFKNKLAKCNQAHLLKFWESLNDQENDQFLKQLNTIDFEDVNTLFEKSQRAMQEDVKKLDDRMKPIPASKFETEKGSSSSILEDYKQTALEAIANNQVCVLLLAGGQGTRLGVSHPKGMFSVGLPSGKTLFQIQAERIRRVVNIAKEHTGKLGKICWYIMTSGPTNSETQQYLKENNYFGLNKDDVVLFQQGLLPCFDFDGKIILEERNKVALAPDGNGGIYRALDKSGVLDDMESRGIKYIHVHSVDNILVKVADPIFIGYCIKKDANCGAKVVRKASPKEAVGVVCQVDGRFQVVEYSEITEKTAKLCDNDGKLIFSAGNICNHFFNAQFLREIVTKYEKELKLHVAKKKIPYVDETGTKIKPNSPNGIKIEKFVFDVFQFTDKFVTWEVPRINEFSALKNGDDVGKDCPSTARRDLLKLHQAYVENAGGYVEDSAEVEISPLLSYAGENLESKVRGKVFSKTVILTEDSADGYSNGIPNGKSNGIGH